MKHEVIGAAFPCTNHQAVPQAKWGRHAKLQFVLIMFYSKHEFPTHIRVGMWWILTKLLIFWQDRLSWHVKIDCWETADLQHKNEISRRFCSHRGSCKLHKMPLHKRSDKQGATGLYPWHSIVQHFYKWLGRCSSDLQKTPHWGWVSSREK